jgi:hypothetical protein
VDITVYESDRRRAPGHLSRQGPPALRWALYEAAQLARHPRSPDRDYYLQAAERLGGNRACLSLARKLLSRRHARVDGLQRLSGRDASPSGITPSTIMSPARNDGSWTEIRLGARAHNTRTNNHAHAPPANGNTNHINPDRVLDTWSLHR